VHYPVDSVPRSLSRHHPALTNFDIGIRANSDTKVLANQQGLLFKLATRFRLGPDIDITIA
jgi:hypothetical protein